MRELLFNLDWNCLKNVRTARSERIDIGVFCSQRRELYVSHIPTLSFTLIEHPWELAIALWIASLRALRG